MSLVHQFAEQSPMHREWVLFGLTYSDTLKRVGAGAMQAAFIRAYRDGEPLVYVADLALARTRRNHV